MITWGPGRTRGLLLAAAALAVIAAAVAGGVQARAAVSGPVRQPVSALPGIQGGAGDAPGTTASHPKAVVIHTEGIHAGLTLGPRDGIWLVGRARSGAYVLQSVNPVSNRITTYSLGGGPVVYNGQLALDGAGNAWLSAKKGAGLLLERFTPATRRLKTFGVPSACGAISGLRTASDGHVWAVCASSVLRLDSDGQLATIQLPSPLSSVTGLAPGPGGVMWAVADTGKIFRYGRAEFAPSGKVTLFPDHVPYQYTQGIFGNGSNVIASEELDTTTYTVKVAPDGGETLSGYDIPLLPSDMGALDEAHFWGYYNYAGYQGNPDPIPYPFYFVDADVPGGGFSFGGFSYFPLQVTTSKGAANLNAQGPPVYTNGSFWVQQAGTPFAGSVVRLTP